MKFGTAVRIARNLEGITQKELAKELNTSQIYLCNIEKNRNLPSFPVAWKIQERFPDEKLLQAYQETYRNTLSKL
mgnify:CR=1 FL=1